MQDLATGLAIPCCIWGSLASAIPLLLLIALNSLGGKESHE